VLRHDGIERRLRREFSPRLYYFPVTKNFRKLLSGVTTFTFLTRNRMGLLQLIRRNDNGRRGGVAPRREKSSALKVPPACNYAAIPKRYRAEFPLVLRSLPISVQFKKVPARGSGRTPHTIIPLSQLRPRQRRLINLTTSVITAVIWPSRLQNEIRLLHWIRMPPERTTEGLIVIRIFVAAADDGITRELPRRDRKTSAWDSPTR